MSTLLKFGNLIVRGSNGMLMEMPSTPPTPPTPVLTDGIKLELWIDQFYHDLPITDNFNIATVATSTSPGTWAYINRYQGTYGLRRSRDTIWHHLVVTISKKNNFLRIWDNGVLQFNATLNWLKTDNEILSVVSGDGFKNSVNIGNLAEFYVSQFGVREGVWTDAIDYTAPTQPYLAIGDYF